MASGDRIPTELVAPTALSSAAATLFTNSSSAYRTQGLAISLANTGTASRTVTLYKNGNSANSTWLNGIVVGAAASVVIPCSKVFTGTQILAGRQDTGTDVILSFDGIVEEI